MSFDIFFQPCRYAGEAVETKNPFTGQTQKAVSNAPLTAAEVRAVQALLQRVHAAGPGKRGCYTVEFFDGGRAEIFAENLSRSCMVALRGLSPDVVKFLYELLQAGNWLMCPAMDDNVAIACSPSSVVNPPEDYPKVVVCTGAEELGALLSGGVKAWRQYRDRVVEGN